MRYEKVWEGSRPAITLNSLEELPVRHAREERTRFSPRSNNIAFEKGIARVRTDGFYAFGTDFMAERLSAGRRQDPFFP